MGYEGEPQTPVEIGLCTLKHLAVEIAAEGSTDPDLVARFESLLTLLDKSENRNVEFAQRLVDVEESVQTIRNVLQTSGHMSSQPAGQRLTREDLPNGF